MTERKNRIFRLLYSVVQGSHVWAKSWIILICFWAPVFCALYPGVLTYDGLYEIKWFLVDGVVTDFHTLAHSAWLSASVFLGKNLFGDFVTGQALYTVTQSLLLSGCFSYCVASLRDFSVPPLAILGALAWFAVFPVHSIMAVSATKDVAFTAFFAVSVVLIAKMIANPRSYFSRVRNVLGLAICLFLMFAFRKNGLLVFAVCLPIIVIASVGARRQIAVLGLCCMVVGMIYFGSLSSVFLTQETPTVPPSGTTEALSVPMQQVARVMVEDGDALDQDTKEQIALYLPSWSRYDERIVDPIKFGDRVTSEIENDPGGFMSLWANLALRFPGEYFDAWVAMSYGWWDPFFRYTEFSEGRPYLEMESAQRESISDGDADRFIYIEQTGNSLLKRLACGVIYRAPWESIPLVSQVFAPASMVWIIVVCAVILAFRRRTAERLSVALLLPIVYAASCLLGPTVMIRYAFPLFAVAPLAAAFAIAGICSRKGKMSYHKNV